MTDTNENKIAVKRYPSNNEAEQYLLCCMLIDGDVASTVIPEMEENFFFNATHRKIFNAMHKLYSYICLELHPIYHGSLWQHPL